MLVHLATHMGHGHVLGEPHGGDRDEAEPMPIARYFDPATQLAPAVNG